MPKQIPPRQAEKLGALAGRVESLVDENEGLLGELQAVKERQGAGAAAAGREGPLVAMLKAENAALQEEAEAVRGRCRVAVLKRMCVPVDRPKTFRAHHAGCPRGGAGARGRGGQGAAVPPDPTRLEACEYGMFFPGWVCARVRVSCDRSCRLTDHHPRLKTNAACRREMDAEVRALEGEVTELRGERDRFQQLLIEVGGAPEPRVVQRPTA